MSTFQQILLIAVVVTAWAWISSEEYDDEIENERHYCSMIIYFMKKLRVSMAGLRSSLEFNVKQPVGN